MAVTCKQETDVQTKMTTNSVKVDEVVSLLTNIMRYTEYTKS